MPKEALVSSTTHIRQAPETREPYRLVEAEDILLGREDIIMIDLTHFRPGLPVTLWRTWKIRLDDEPLRDTEFGPCVFYYCTEPFWDGQCFVPLADFLGKVDFGPGDHTRYWIKYDPAEVRAV
jgi:hypothetical protein